MQLTIGCKGGNMTQLPKSDNLDIQKFSNIFNSMSTSYKIYWFYAIFEEIVKGKRRFSFKEIAIRMCIKAWYTTVEYKLSLGVVDQIASIIDILKNRYMVDSKLSDEKKYIIISQLNDTDLERALNDLTKYVPFRLLSPFIEGLNLISEGEKQSVIEKYSLQRENILYKIYSRDKVIEIQSEWFEYIYSNQIIIRGWIEWNLISYLTRRNPNVPGIANKLSAPTSSMRSLTTQTKFWKEVMKFEKIQDIYMLKNVDEADLSLDHFIPWSFVLHNELWNLVPTTRSINSQKSDNLPILEREFENFKTVQYEAVKVALREKFGKKLLEDYYIVFRELLTAERLKKEVFFKGLDETILPLYQIAQNQGFQVWKRS